MRTRGGVDEGNRKATRYISGFSTNIPVQFRKDQHKLDCVGNHCDVNNEDKQRIFDNGKCIIMHAPTAQTHK